MSSIFGSTSPGQNLFPPPTSGALNGKLDAKDTAWMRDAPKGFCMETHAFHSQLDDGSWFIIRFAYTLPGIWMAPTTTQAYFKRYDPSSQTVTEKVTSLTGWKTEGQNASSNEFTLKHTGSPTTEETYTIKGSGDGLTADLVFVRPASCPGFKIGSQGTTYFGSDNPKKADGFVLSRFLPVLTVAGTIVVDGHSMNVQGESSFFRSVQAMRPNLVARRWNFSFFSSPPTGEGGKGRTRALMLEFETPDNYGVGGKGVGRDKISIGAIVLDGKLTLVSSAVNRPEGLTGHGETVCGSTDVETALDAVTGYSPPSRILFDWAGQSETGQGLVSAQIATSTPTADLGQDGFVDRVDVFARMPALVRKIVVSVASSQPFVYQHFRPAVLKVSTGSGESKGEQSISGSLYTELSFIS